MTATITVRPITSDRRCRVCNAQAFYLETVAIDGRPDLDAHYPLCAHHGTEAAYVLRRRSDDLTRSGLATHPDGPHSDDLDDVHTEADYLAKLDALEGDTNNCDHCGSVLDNVWDDLCDTCNQAYEADADRTAGR